MRPGRWRSPAGVPISRAGRRRPAARSARSISMSTACCGRGWRDCSPMPAGCPKRRWTVPSGCRSLGSGSSIRSTARATISAGARAGRCRSRCRGWSCDDRCSTPRAPRTVERDGGAGGAAQRGAAPRGKPHDPRWCPGADRRLAQDRPPPDHGPQAHPIALRMAMVAADEADPSRRCAGATNGTSPRRR